MHSLGASLGLKDVSPDLWRATQFVFGGRQRPRPPKCPTLQGCWGARATWIAKSVPILEYPVLYVPDVCVFVPKYHIENSLLRTFREETNACTYLGAEISTPDVSGALASARMKREQRPNSTYIRAR